MSACTRIRMLLHGSQLDLLFWCGCTRYKMKRAAWNVSRSEVSLAPQGGPAGADEAASKGSARKGAAAGPCRPRPGPGEGAVVVFLWEAADAGPVPDDSHTGAPGTLPCGRTWRPVTGPRVPRSPVTVVISGLTRLFPTSACISHPLWCQGG